MLQFKIHLSPMRLTMYTEMNIIRGKGGDNMATTPTQIRIDADIKQEATILFSKLGLDMSVQ